MRVQSRNRVPFYYSNYEGKVPIKDNKGNFTGEYKLSFTQPKGHMGVVSVARGEADTELFGTNLAYDKILIVDNMKLDINEYSHLWIDKLPEIDGDGSTVTSHDYIVVRVAKSLNFITYAVKRVDVMYE